MGTRKRTLRKGLPLFVVFIICDEVAWGVSVTGMATVLCVTMGLGVYLWSDYKE